MSREIIYVKEKSVNRIDVTTSEDREPKYLESHVTIKLDILYTDGFLLSLEFLMDVGQTSKDDIMVLLYQRFAGITGGGSDPVHWEQFQKRIKFNDL